MNADNETDQDVDYEQAGGGGFGEGQPCQQGQLSPRGTTGSNKSFSPCDPSPWTVTFRSGSQSASSEPITDPDATVTLEANWTVTVS
jgi:hypothetical protein